MTFALVGDILYMILDILGDERDYNSLFQCSISSRCFTEHSLAVLYKLYNESPVRSGGSEDEQFRTRRAATTLPNPRREGDVATRKWALMWRSIVLSTLDQTYLPYYSYTRFIDYDDLLGLLVSPGFSGKIKDDFFTPELVAFLDSTYEPKGSKRLRSSKISGDSNQIVLTLCSEIVKKAASIRGVSCNVSSSALIDWLDQLPLLQDMTIWSGASLMPHAADKIRNNCPDFKKLTIYQWEDSLSSDVEVDSETFFNGLRPNTLEFFQTISCSQLGPRSIKALGTQLGSITELKLTSLTSETIAEMPSLTEPPCLRILVLTDSIPSIRNEKYYSIVTRLAEWIRSCKALRHLELRRFLDDPLLLSNVLADDKLRLSTLSLSSYNMTGSGAFHEALAFQNSLQSLTLRGEANEFPTDNDLLVNTICNLNNLRELELKDISDCFTLDNVMSLTPFLPKLERLWISGDYFNDAAWSAFICFPNLQSLSISALSEFTAEGILNFISQLGPTNKGFSLSILNSVSETNITEEAQNLIREAMKASLDGSFDFGLALGI
ncbi:hypothetical protein FE257_010051 [Aspergillus nanangensis]|uniref:Uncharacterized protein n=1 Tax=Aspergillus nanangensis TaxID=2582783 RepID=A0AAD4CWA3_ASPNN|nr:hypothetical protein FE257_010051 [Aspergillus nanangensis]